MQFTAEELARIDDYAQRMHDPKNGIEIKDRKYKLKTYQQCFLGNFYNIRLINTIFLGD